MNEDSYFDGSWVARTPRSSSVRWLPSTKASSCSPSFIAKRKNMAVSPKKPFTISHLYSSPKAKRMRNGEKDEVMKESKNETTSPVVTFADDLDRTLFESLEESTSKDKFKPTMSLNFEAEKGPVIRSHA